MTRKTAEETKAEETTTKSNGVEISLTDAIRLYGLYSNIKNADLHFQSCQAVNFRQHVHDACNAANVVNAFENLNKAIEEHKTDGK